MEQSHVEALRARYEAASESTFGAVFEDVHPEFEMKTSDRVPGAGTYHGRAAATRFYEELFEPFEEVAYEPQKFFARGDQIAVFLVIRFKPQGSTAVVENLVGALWTFRDGKPIRCEMFARREDALEAAGMSDRDAVPA